MSIFREKFLSTLPELVRQQVQSTVSTVETAMNIKVPWDRLVAIVDECYSRLIPQRSQTNQPLVDLTKEAMVNISTGNQGVQGCCCGGAQGQQNVPVKYSSFFSAPKGEASLTTPPRGAQPKTPASPKTKANKPTQRVQILQTLPIKHPQNHRENNSHLHHREGDDGLPIMQDIGLQNLHKVHNAVIIAKSRVMYLINVDSGHSVSFVGKKGMFLKIVMKNKTSACTVTKWVT